MTFLRHSARHIHESAVEHVTAGLDSLLWRTPDSVPFDEAPIQIRTTKAFLGDRLAPNIGAGVVCMTMGSELAPNLVEMGGPLSEQEFPLFFDVFMDTEAVTMALACDIRDILIGRVDGFAPVIPVVDQITGVVVPGWKIEFEDIERVAPEHAFPLHWQTVNATARVTFQEVVW